MKNQVTAMLVRSKIRRKIIERYQQTNQKNNLSKYQSLIEQLALNTSPKIKLTYHIRTPSNAVHIVHTRGQEAMQHQKT
jgi:hypothetical protein